MRNIIKKSKTFLADEKGSETVEWVLIASILAGIIVSSFWINIQGAVNAALISIATFIATVSG